VEIVYSYAQASPAPLLALVRDGVDGIIFAAPGAGSLSDAERDVIAKIAAMAVKPVLMRSSRTGNGRVTRRQNFDRLGVIPTDNLNPQKARILLMLALAKTRDPAEIARIFSQY
jgi:L-asparaginase